MNLHIYRYIVAGFLTVVLTSSCKKSWFDEPADKNVVIPQTISDFEMLLDNESMSFGTPAIGEISSGTLNISQDIWAFITSSTDPGSVAQRNAYTWSNDFPYEKLVDWDNAYTRIFYSNLVLEGIKKINVSGSAEMERLRHTEGNALFHRAKNYLELSQLYSEVYDAKTDNSGIGIVIKTEVDVTEKSRQETVKNCYDIIISDLKLAAEYLPLNSSYQIRGSRVAAYALISRTFLIMQDYSNAAIYADSVLKYASQLTDLNDIPVTNLNVGRFNKEVIFYSQMLPYPLVTSAYFYVESQFLDKYNSNDLRRSRFFSLNPDGSYTFKGSYTDDPYLLFTGIATDEFYLIKAECLARNGKTNEAMNFLNKLLIKRWDKNVNFEPETASSPTEALLKVLEERNKELLLRGIRWSDLRRLNLEDITKTTLTRIIGGKTYTLEPNSYRYTFPIPVDVLGLASEMKQTPGWGK